MASNVTAAANGRKPKHRSEALDVARLLAAMGVIWIHACQTPETVQWTRYGRFAVPFFAAAAAFLAVRSFQRAEDLPAGTFVRQKFQRLYVPFLVWSGVYLVFRTGNAFLTQRGTPPAIGWNLLWEGGAYHLWFIPFLFVGMLGLYALHRWLVRYNASPRLFAIAFAIFGGFVAFLVNNEAMPDASLTYMIWATPGLLWGAALAWLPIRLPTTHPGASLRSFFWRARPWFPILGLACVCLLISFQLQAQMPRNAILENTAGVSLLLAALYVPRFGNMAWLAALGRLSLGIYFSHLVFLKIAAKGLASTSLGSGLTYAVLVTLVSALAAIVVSWTLARFSWTRNLVA